MKPLTPIEIKFIERTNYTATVWQCDEWYRTIWEHKPTIQELVDWFQNAGITEIYGKPTNATTVEHFLDYLHEKFSNEEDAISLENLAVYLFRTFLTREEMIGLMQRDCGCDSTAVKFLKNWKYYNGFRKLDDATSLLGMALDPHWVYAVDDDGDVWYDYIED